MRNEESNIKLVLQAILEQEYARERLEVLVCDGRSSDRTREVVEQFRQQHPLPAVRLLDNPSRKQEPGLNLGIRAATGEVVLRMDARSRIPRNYVARCVELLSATGADNVGGVQKAIGKSPTQLAIAWAMTHPFGVGNARFRIGGYTGPVESLYLGCFRRSTFDRIGLFDDKTPHISEDSDINERIRAAGGIVFLDSTLEVGYEARETFGLLWRLYFDYGLRRTGFFFKHRRLTSWRQVIPPALVLSIIGLAGTTVLTSWGGFLLMLVLGAYAAAVVVTAVQLSARYSRLSWAPRVATTFACMHFAYGMGFLWGCSRRLVS